MFNSYVSLPDGNETNQRVMSPFCPPLDRISLLGHLVIPGSSLIHEDEAHHLTWFTQQTDMDSMLKIGAAWWCNNNLEKYYLECVYVYIYIYE